MPRFPASTLNKLKTLISFSFAVNTLFRPAAFWALVTADGACNAHSSASEGGSEINASNSKNYNTSSPSTFSGKQQDFCRKRVIDSLFVQRLLLEIGENVEFLRPDTRQSGSSWEEAQETVIESNSHTKNLSDVIHFFRKWKCSEKTFFDCILKLRRDLFHNKFLYYDDSELLSLWLLDLSDRSIFYDQPSIKQIDERINGSYVRFYPRVSNNPTIPWDDMPHVPRDLKSVCNDSYVSRYEKTLQRFNGKRRKDNDVFDNGLMIIVFNHMDWFDSTIKYLEIMHRGMFRNIIYCGANPDGNIVKKAENTTGIKLSFLTAPISNGYYLYRCLIKASRMGYNVTGHFIIADDTILYTWHIPPLDASQVWAQTIFNFTCSKGTIWPWWRRFKPGFSKSYEFLTNISHINTHEGDMSRTLVERYGLNTDYCIHGLGDIYYVPTKFMKDVVFFMEKFSPNDVFLELVTPYSLVGAVGRENIFHLLSTDYYHSRNHIWRYYKPEEEYYLHPIKYSNSDNRINFCSVFMEDMIERLA